MHSLRLDDVERARLTSPAEKAAQAFEMMRMGIRLKRMALRRAHADVSEEEIERLLECWLLEHE